MGSAVSVVNANLVKEDVDKRAFATLHSPPRFWKHFVDDTCTALPRDMLKSFHSHLNSIEPCIQFTVEEESEGRMLPFLDVEPCQDSDGTITTLAYQKTKHTNQYLSFASHHPVTHKVAVVRTLMSRANTLSSSGVQQVEEEKKIVDVLKENGYPSSFTLKHSRPTRHRQEADVRRPRTTVTLPYMHGLSEALRWILTQLNIKVVFHPLSTLHHMLVHPKDPVSLDQQKGVVYSIPCNGCPKVYIGQTGRTLRHQLAEHQWVLKNGDVAASALAEHTLEASCETSACSVK